MRDWAEQLADVKAKLAPVEGETMKWIDEPPDPEMWERIRERVRSGSESAAHARETGPVMDSGPVSRGKGDV